jgi:hypothetical protein
MPQTARLVQEKKGRLPLKKVAGQGDNPGEYRSVIPSSLPYDAI